MYVPTPTVWDIWDTGLCLGNVLQRWPRISTHISDAPIDIFLQHACAGERDVRLIDWLYLINIMPFFCGKCTHQLKAHGLPWRSFDRVLVDPPCSGLGMMCANGSGVIVHLKCCVCADEVWCVRMRHTRNGVYFPSKVSFVCRRATLSPGAKYRGTHFRFVYAFCFFSISSMPISSPTSPPPPAKHLPSSLKTLCQFLVVVFSTPSHFSLLPLTWPACS